MKGTVSEIDTHVDYAISNVRDMQIQIYKCKYMSLLAGKSSSKFSNL